MKTIILLLFTGYVLNASAQTAQPLKAKLYDPSADAKVDIKAVVERAKNEGKHVFVQIGGNWCSWCFLFDDKVMNNDTLKTVLEKNYIIYRLNYSRENLNEDILASWGYPERFGFPVFVILDGNGNRLHTQNSAYLEQGKGHNTQAVLSFFNHWTPAAIDPKTYQKQVK